MQPCRFCGREFRNQQAVRAHLRACIPYRERRLGDEPGADSAGMPSVGPSIEPGVGEPAATPVGDKEGRERFDPVKATRRRVQEEEAKFRLRQVQAAHRDLDAHDADLERRRREEEEAKERREAARLRAEQEAAARRKREEEERDRQRQRREIIQRAKDRAVRRYWSYGHVIPPEAEAEALREVERDLAALPVEELPWLEVLAVAEGARERIYRPLLEAQDEAKKREEERREKERQQQERERREREEAHRKEVELMRQKRRLISHGEAHALKELRGARGIRPLDRLTLIVDVRRALEAALTGEEGREEVEDLVDEVLGE